MNNLLGSLGLENVSADPNAVPDGKYPARVTKSELVYSKTKDSIAHVITYTVEDGQFKGAQQSDWFTLGTNPQYDEQGNITSYTPTMSEQQKQWYKKRYVDLGIPEADIPNTAFEQLVGIPVVMGTKKNGQYTNVNFIEVRDGGTAAPQASAPSPQAQQTGNLTGLL